MRLHEIMAAIEDGEKLQVSHVLPYRKLIRAAMNLQRSEEVFLCITDISNSDGLCYVCTHSDIDLPVEDEILHILPLTK